MKFDKACLSLFFLLCLLLAGCGQQSLVVAPKKQQGPAVFRLFDLFQPEDLIGKLSPEDVGWKRVEWRAEEMAPWTAPSTNATKRAASADPVIAFRALNDLNDLKVEQGKLTGTISGPTPVLDFALYENRGGAESVKFIEIRMNVGGAKQIWLRTEGSTSVDDAEQVKWASQTNSWNTSADVAENKIQTYRFEFRSGGGGGRGGPPPAGGPPGVGPPPAGPPGGPGGPPPVMIPVAGPGPGGPPPGNAPPPPGGPSGQSGNNRDLRHFLITFRECNSPRFSIESIRIVSEREEKLKEASGQQWAGLAEIYHAALSAKAPEAIKIPVRELPEHAWLEFAIGTSEDSPVKFKVAISNREAKESAPVTILERTLTIPNRWQNVRVDLAAYAGKTVLLDFSLSGDKKGLWGYWGSPVIRTHAGVVGGSSTTKSKPRGVIFLVIDTLRKDHLNIYGYPRETTVHLKKFADEGVAFSHAISQATMTKISIPSMVTSLYPLSHTVLGFDKGLPASAKTIAEVFREEGYATVGYSSVPFTGKSNNMHQGYDELHESASISDSEYRSKTSRHYVDRLITWLKEHPDTPFFAFLHCFDPHSPFRPRPPYDTLWGAPGAKDRLAEIEADLRNQKIRLGMDNLPTKEDYLKSKNDPDELLKIYTDWYDGSIRGIDAEIGRLLEALKELGLDQDTLMVFGADHGEELWEHGRFFHGHSVYGELNQVPLVFHWPNNPEIRKGVMIDKQIQNIDIMPTILNLVGIQGPTNMQGRSLLPLLNGSGVANWEERPAITQAMVGAGPGGPPGEKPHFGIIDKGWKLVRKEIDPEKQEELYEHPIDYLNLTNVIKSEGPASHVKGLNETLESWKTMARASQLPSDETMTQNLSSEELRRLRALGYVGGGGGGGNAPKPATNNPPNRATNAAPSTATNAGPTVTGDKR